MTRVGVAVVTACLLIAAPACGSHQPPRSAAATVVKRTTTETGTAVATAPARLAESVTGSLGSALQDPSSAALGGGRVLLLGGLTAADASSDSIITATAGSGRLLGRLPSARHDTSAVRIGRFVYLFGGGTATEQLGDVVQVDPASGRNSLVAHLPAVSSDSSAAAIDGTAYIIGGYTGTAWLDTIVAWRPGSAAHVVARLPAALRYAAVTAVEGGIVIAGGSLENGTASDAVLEYLPSTHRVVRSAAASTTSRCRNARWDCIRDRRPWRDRWHSDREDRVRRRRGKAHSRCGCTTGRALRSGGCGRWLANPAGRRSRGKRNGGDVERSRAEGWREACGYAACQSAGARRQRLCA